MSIITNIAWTDRTWNPWRGCTKISEGCKNCYMFAGQRRYGRDPSVLVRSGTFNDPLRWQKEALAQGLTPTVFTCSWSDWFHEAADAWRDDAWNIVKRCTNLTFQILTKRADRMIDHLPADWGHGYANVWLGVSVENNDRVARAAYLRQIPAVVRFISYEPALGPLNDLDLHGIDWVIFGGESGPKFRPMDVQWARDMRDRCREAGVAFFFKQSAARLPERDIELDGQVIREFPTPRAAHGMVAARTEDGGNE